MNLDNKKSYLFMGSIVNIIISGNDTNGSLTLVEHIERKGGEPPFHIHHNEDELIYVKEGTLNFFLDDEVIHAQEGDSIFLPRGIPHKFELESEQVNFLTTAVSSGYDDFIKEVGKTLNTDEIKPKIPTTEDVKNLVSIGKKYNMSFLINNKWL